MRPKRPVVFFILFLTIALLLAGCGTGRGSLPPRTAGLDFCAAAPEQCQERCAGCPDRAGCFERGGECALAAGSLNDTGDNGPDVFTPGCHWEYDDAQCTQGQKFFSVDECTEANSRMIWEWLISACHLPTGDIDDFDCDIECRRVGRGGGRCAWADNICDGRASAYCKCDVPPPNPTKQSP